MVTNDYEGILLSQRLYHLLDDLSFELLCQLGLKDHSLIRRFLEVEFELLDDARLRGFCKIYPAPGIIIY